MTRLEQWVGIKGTALTWFKSSKTRLSLWLQGRFPLHLLKTSMGSLRDPSWGHFYSVCMCHLLVTLGSQKQEHILSLLQTPKVAFAASLGGNGLQKTTTGNKNLIYKDVLTNVGGAYNSQTGEFTAPVRGVYYIRFTANSPTDFPMSAVLYKNGAEIQLIAHEQPSGEGSDTASNGAALLLEEGDKLKMVLWLNTQIWDNSNHHSTFSGFLLFPM
uniref:C1q domain-containing protein n=1 Tax=Myripristis murdjan TaxID=586833 RepID=A0A668A419_9TELE